MLSLLRFYINCIKRTVVLAGTALDTDIRVNMVTFLDLACDGSHRTVSGTLAAALAEFRIDLILAQSLAGLCPAFLIHDMLHIFIPESL